MHSCLGLHGACILAARLQVEVGCIAQINFDVHFIEIGKRVFTERLVLQKGGFLLDFFDAPGFSPVKANRGVQNHGSAIFFEARKNEVGFYSTK